MVGKVDVVPTFLIAKGYRHVLTLYHVLATQVQTKGWQGTLLLVVGRDL